MLAAIFGLVVAGCASSPRINAPPPSLASAGAPVEVADVDVLYLSPEMERFLERYVLSYENPHTRLRLLTIAIMDPAVLGFRYRDDRTATALEAFEERSGNCIAFANLFVTMARRSGLDAHYQEVSLRPEYSSHEDTVLVENHINVLVELPLRTYVIDASGRKIREDDPRRSLPDHQAKAHYFNNLGVEALLDDDLATAHAYLVRAIETAPDLSDAWSNLGVVLSRNGQVDDAELAYRVALQANAREYSAMGNLYNLYLKQGNDVAAERMSAKVERYRRKNPYYLLRLSERAIERRQYGDAITLLERAIRQKEDEHLLHFAMARSQYLSGRIEAAQSSLERARELAPDEMLAKYSLSLHDLMGSE